MKENYRSCIICGEKDYSLIWNKEQRRKNNTMICKNIIEQNGKCYNMMVVICNNCGLIFTNPQITENDLNEFYKKNYRKIYQKDKKDQQIMDNNSRIHALSTIETIKSIDEKFETYLDIGCNDKQLISELRRNPNTLKAEGLDPNTNIQGVYHDPSEINSHYKYDVITCMNTLEHIYDPIKLLASIKKHVKKYIVVGVPNVFGRINCTVDAFFSCAHLWHFSTISLTQVLNKAGYQHLFFAEANEPMCKKIHLVSTPSVYDTLENIPYNKPIAKNIVSLFEATDNYQKAQRLKKFEI